MSVRIFRPENRLTDFDVNRVLEKHVLCFSCGYLFSVIRNGELSIVTCI